MHLSSPENARSTRLIEQLTQHLLYTELGAGALVNPGNGLVVTQFVEGETEARETSTWAAVSWVGSLTWCYAIMGHWIHLLLPLFLHSLTRRMTLHTLSARYVLPSLSCGTGCPANFRADSGFVTSWAEVAPGDRPQARGTLWPSVSLHPISTGSLACILASPGNC